MCYLCAILQNENLVALPLKRSPSKVISTTWALEGYGHTESYIKLNITALTACVRRKFMITRISIVFENLLASSIAPQVVPPCLNLSVL